MKLFCSLRRGRILLLLTVLLTLAACTATGQATMKPTPTSTATPTATVTAAADHVVIGTDGKALAPTNVPAPADKRIIATVVQAANALVGLPSRYGGGHAPYAPSKAGQLPPPERSGYDGSGAVSYVLHAAGVISEPLDNSGLRYKLDEGPGQWIRVVDCSNVDYLTVGGARFDRQVDRIASPIDSTQAWAWYTDPRDIHPNVCLQYHPANY